LAFLGRRKLDDLALRHSWGNLSIRPYEHMISIKKQFLYDEEQHPVKVLLDYSEWLKIEQALGGKALEANGHLLNSFAGKIHFGADPLEIQRAMRAEWPD